MSWKSILTQTALVPRLRCILCAGALSALISIAGGLEFVGRAVGADAGQFLTARVRGEFVSRGPATRTPNS